jgi:GTP-binding protein
MQSSGLRNSTLKTRQKIRCLFELILRAVPPPEGDGEGPLKLLVTNIDYNDYVGRLAIGRIFSGSVNVGDWISMINGKEEPIKTKVTSLYGFQGLERVELRGARAGDIVALAGIEGINIGDTISDVEDTEPLPRIAVDEPTISMVFSVNTSPFAGQDGKYVTSRNLRSSLKRSSSIMCRQG